ncbi:MAG: DNA polymerase I, partial [Clostridia bacterium]|nr:DNA polymerase I [Clostridia bacterium]
MKILALDGNSIINRAFYGIRVLSNKNGVFTNAIYGFMNILLKLIDTNSPDLIIAAFDLKAPTFRHKIYDKYKAGRKPMPDELAMQIPIMKEILKNYGCIVLEKEGYEADDILGTIAKKCNENGDSCVIATGDRDSLQLVSQSVTVQLAATKAGAPEVRIYDIQKIKEEYGVLPEQMIEIKALQGDNSDNIPGVQGVGPKTAGDLIQKYGSIEKLYDNIEEKE